MNQPERLSIPIGGYRIVAHRWSGNSPTILFCHATGFHGRIWDRIISHLGDYDCVSIDLRGHGDSDKPDTSYNWDSFVPDVLEIIRKLGINDVIGVGHSMGAHVITKAAIGNPSLIRGLVLCDPSIFERHRYRDFNYSQKTEHPVSKRRNNWESPKEMYDRLRRHKNFALWEPDVLDDYCNYGLELNQEGSHYQLKCPPSVEAQMYGAYIDPSIIEELPKYKNPVHVMLARERLPEEKFMELGPSITRPDLKDLLPNSTFERFGSNSHFLPMENTEAVSKSIKEMVTRVF